MRAQGEDEVSGMLHGHEYTDMSTRTSQRDGDKSGSLGIHVSQ